MEKNRADFRKWVREHCQRSFIRELQIRGRGRGRRRGRGRGRSTRFCHNEIFKLFRLQLGRDEEVDCNNNNAITVTDFEHAHNEEKLDLVLVLVLVFESKARYLQERDFSSNAAVLAKAAKIVRRDLFSHNGFSFSGTFPVGCQESSVLASLKFLF